MNKIIILTDSTSDIRGSEIDELQIDFVPLNVIMEGKNYLDSVEIQPDEFYEKLPNCKHLPTTSQPSTGAFIEKFEKAKNDGDSLIYIGISSGLSGTIQGAKIAREMVEYDKIYIIDSLTSIQGLRLLVIEACRQRDKGLEASVIVANIETLKKRIRIFSMIDTLEYLYRGGRLSRAKAIIGNLVHIKPLIDLDGEGKVQMYDKSIGRNRAYRMILNSIRNHPIDDQYQICYGYTSDINLLNELINHVSKTYGEYNYDISQIGPVIGTHIGENGFCMVYIEKETSK